MALGVLLGSCGLGYVTGPVTQPPVGVGLDGGGGLTIPDIHTSYSGPH